MTDVPLIDLHMHTTVSDGTDTPEEILARVKRAGLGVFSVTDHDAFKSGVVIRELLGKDDPCFILGAEFSCKDEEGQYHILGYGFDPDSDPVRSVVETGHRYRMEKVGERLDYLKRAYGFTFPAEEIDGLYALDNPGKPHIASLMVEHGYASTIEEAIKRYINGIRFTEKYVRPENAIAGILGSGGIPVLAHPAYGSGDQIILGEEMERRLQKLISFGLRGLEAYYSGFTARLRSGMLRLAERYGLYVTAGSDYHGSNKLIELADTGLESVDALPEGLARFLKDVRKEDHDQI